MGTPHSRSGLRGRLANTCRRMVTAIRRTRWGILCILLGLGIAIAVVLPRPDSKDPDYGDWLVWAGCAVAVGIAAGAIIVYGLRRWHELQEIRRVPMRKVRRPVAGVGLLAVIGINSTFREPGYHWQTAVLVTGATLAGAAAAGAMYGIGVAATDVVNHHRPGAAVERLLKLRRLLERLLEALGGIVLLVTLLESAQNALDTEQQRPWQYTLIFGGFGSLLVALVYVPSWSALRREVEQACNKLFPLATVDKSSDLLTRVEDRQKLATNLGYHRTLAADLQAGLLIAAPLLTGATSAILQR